MPKRSIRVIVIALFALIFFAGPSLVRFYTDWLWFGEVGYQFVFATMLRSQGTLFTIAFGVTVVWLVLNLRTAIASIGDLRPVFTTREGIQVALPSRHQLRTLTSAAAALVAIPVGLYAAGRWNLWMACRHAVPFGQVDPLRGRDVSFYIFTLPFLQFVRSLMQGLVVLAAIGSGALYFVCGSLNTSFPAAFGMTANARRHLSLLAAVFLLLLAFGAWLQRSEYLIPTGGASAGASYADDHGRRPVTLRQMVAGVVGSGLAVLEAFRRQKWPIPAAVGLDLVVSIGGEVYSSMLQRFVRAPNEHA